MKQLSKITSKYTQIMFLDFEGTQLSHEIIAIGATKATLKPDGSFKHLQRGYKNYVMPKHNIGKYVEEMTGITKDVLKKNKAISFRLALENMKKYCKNKYNSTLFVTFGSHDQTMLLASLDNNMDANKDIVYHFNHNWLDLSAFIYRFIRTQNNNTYGLVDLLKMFGVKFKGTEHDPIADAMNLAYLYDAFLKNKKIVLEEYLKTLTKIKHGPDPVKRAIEKLASGKDVTAEEFIELAKKDIE